MRTFARLGLFAVLLCSLPALAQNVDMTASIGDSPDPVTVNVDTITYTATLTNTTSGVAAVSPTLTVSIPAGSLVQGMTATNSGTCTGSAPTITCTWASFSGFASRTATITITPTSGGTVTATATASAGNETATANNSASTTTTVNASIDLAVTGTSDSPTDVTLGLGENVTYSVSTYSYSGSKATNPVLTINLPASSTYVSHTVNGGGSCTLSGSVLTCTWSSQNGFTGYSATVTVTPGAGGTNTLTATVAADQSDPTPSNNTKSESTTVNATINLAVTGISDNPTDITLGQGNVTYTINTYNYSSSKATNPVLTVSLPASSTYVSHTVSNSGSCTPSGGTLTCNWTVQNAFTGYSATVTVTPGAGGTNTLTATIAADQGDPTPSNNTVSENTVVNATINLGITNISDNPTDITLGQGNVTYTINTYNYSSSKATNPVLTVNLPASSTYVSHTVTNSGTCSEAGGVLTCNWSAQNAFTGHTVTVTVTPGVGGTNTITATIGADQGDPTPSNNTVSENTVVNATINLGISSISDNPTDITLGQGNVTYTVNTYNYSSSKATNPVLTVNLPASSTYVSHTVTGGGVCSEAGGVLTCNWSVQNAFTSYTTTVTVTPGAGGTNTLTATVGADQGDPTPANNTASEGTTVNATINLAVTGISDNPTDITLGQGNVTYTVNTYNYSSSKATNPVLTINLPASSTYVSHTVTNSGTCSQSGGTLTCNWSVQNAFSSNTVTVTVTPGAGGTNTLTATIAADQGDPTPANNTLSEGTVVNATINLAVTGISDNPTDITLGQGNVTYTINTYNYTSSKATNPVLTVNLPASSTYVSHTVTNSGTCSKAGGVLTCNWSVQNAFSSNTVTVTVTPGAGGTNTLTATIGADQGDPTPANNTLSEGTVVNATINLGISSISDNPNDITLGQGNVVYSLNAYNYSSSKATNPVLTVNLPASSTYVSHTVSNSGTCSLSGSVLTCSWTQQNAFTTHSVTVTGTPGAGGTNTLTATLAADQGDPTPSNNSVSETTTVNATLDLQLSLSDSPDPRVLAQGNVTYSASFFNAMSSKATNPVFTMNVPATTTYVSATPSTGGTCGESGGVVTCTWPDVSGFSSRSVTVVVTPTAAGQISTTATVSADQGDPNTANNTKTATTNINPGSAPTITAFAPTSGPAGTTVTISGSNFFSSTFVKFNGVSAAFTVNNNGSITATVPNGATTGPIAVTNSVGTTTSGSNFTVTPAPDLTISKTASAATVPTGSAFSYSIAVSNNGAGTANDVTVTDTLPAGVTLQGISASGWSCSGTTTITCTHGPLATLATATVITLNVTAPATGTTVVNTATVSSTTPDANNANNSSSVSVGVVGCPTTPPITAPATVCKNSTGHSASTPPVPSATYVWTVTNGTITGGQGTNAITFDAGPSGPIAVAVDVNVTSCPMASNSVSVNVSAPAATITPSGPTSFCAGGSVTLTANSGQSWLWSTGETTQSIVVSTTETITVQVTDAAGCTATSSPVNVTAYPAPPAPIITPSGPTTFCDGGSVTLTASNGSGWLWSNGATSQSVVVNTSQTLTVQVTDANGCPATSAPVTVTVNPLPATPSITADGPLSFCAGQDVVLTAPASAGYLWSNGATTQSITVTAGGTFSVQVSDGNGCLSASSAPVAVNVSPAPPAPSISASGPTTFCPGGSVVLTASNADSWLWSNGATTQSVTVNVSGSYSVQAVNASSCASPQSAPVAVTVTTPPATPSVTASGPTTFCAGGSVTLTAPAADAWLWSNGATTQSIVVNASGTFTVKVKDANGCESAPSAPVNVTVNPIPAATITPGGPTSFCAGGSVVLTASNGDAWLWSNGATTQSITVSTAGTYGVQVTSAGCSAQSAPVTVSVNAPQAVTITGPTSSCDNQTIVLDAGPGFASYHWTNGATTQQITVSPATTTTYGVTVTDANGCTAADTHTVNVTSTPAAAIAAPASVCEGSAGHTASVPVQPGATYAWSIANGTITSGTTGNAVTFTAGAAGQVTLNVTVTNGSCVTPGTTQVAVTPAPAVAIAGPTTVCPNTNLTLAAPGSFVSYLWSNGATSPSITVNQTAATQTYTVTVKDASGCTATGTHTVTLTAQPDATIAAPSEAPEFSGQTASVPAQAGAVYAWSISNGTITGGQGTNAITFDAGPAGTTELGVQVTIGSCLANGNATVTVTGTTPPPCPAAIVQLVAPDNGATVTSPVLLQWAPTAGSTSYDVYVNDTLRATVSATSVTLPLPAGAASWRVVGHAGHCTFGSATRTFTVAEEPAPEPCSARATPFAPANGATVQSSSVLFQWTAANGATGYRVWASVDGGTPVVLGTTTELSLRETLSRGTVLWWVESLYEGCASTESQRVQFTIPAAQNCGTARPETVSPANGSTVTGGEVTFAWSSVPGALGYEVYLALNGGAPSLLGTTSGATSLTAGVPAGELQWFVRVLVDRCPPRDSQTATFTYAPPPSCAAQQRPVLVEPVDGARSASPVSFDWNDVAGATGYQLFVVRGESAPQLVASPTASHAGGVQLGTGRVRWFVRALFGAGCPSLDSAERELQIVPTPAACAPLAPPVISAPAQVSAGTPLRIQWTPVAGATGYQLQLADNGAFANAQTIDTSATQHPATPAQTLYARVRAVDARCAAGSVSPFGPSAAIFILPATAPEGSTPLSDPAPLTFTFVLGPEYAGQSFTAVARQPWLTVTPASGVVAGGGTTLTVVASTAGLPVGTSLGGLTVTLSAPAAGGVASQNSTVLSPSFSVGLVTPVTPSAKDTPPPDALIIPAVAHADGINSHFQSDVRVSNTSARLITYQLTFTPSGESGITQGQQSQFSIEPGRTVALDDVLKTWFGTGNGSAMGTLEIRPLTETSSASEAFGMLRNLTTFASSRTFNVTANGTFGQYVPAVPFASFVGRERILSLQQIAQSSRYRTNLGIVEGSGHPVSLLVRVFGQSGEYLTDFPVSLRGGQHLQLNAFLREQGINTLNDGRVEVEVLSGDGLVTAYASVLDNATSDPLLVTPVAVDSVGQTKWVVPGVADLASGFANWQTDLRLFNAGTAPVEATFTFHSQSGGTPKVKTLTIGPGQVRQFDRALAALFDAAHDAGAVHITTTDPAKLIATARTYNQTGTGTYGQFISAVTVQEAAGLGSRPLQLLQVEESQRFRSNIGLVEVTGKPVKVEIAAVPPDAKFTAYTELELQPNEFRQLGSLLKSMGLDDTHNARVTVNVIDGQGRVTAYASVIDMETNDPTYIPAQ